jgi:large subunit ribosomal protein L2
MGIRVYKPTSAGRRNASVITHDEVTKSAPEKSLLVPLNKTGGRNHQGKITVRGRGGGVKQKYRLIDFTRRDRDGVVGTIAGIEYDPNRSCHIALVEYADGVKRYIIAPKGLTDGDKIVSSSDSAVEPSVGNAMPLRFIPTGWMSTAWRCSPVAVPSSAARPGVRPPDQQGRPLRHPGHAVGRDPPRADRLPGHRRERSAIRTTRTVASARPVCRRLMGRRPITRGVAKSHHTHPLGGGEGRSKSNRVPVRSTRPALRPRAVAHATARRHPRN